MTSRCEDICQIPFRKNSERTVVWGRVEGGGAFIGRGRLLGVLRYLACLQEYIAALLVDENQILRIYQVV